MTMISTERLGGQKSPQEVLTEEISVLGSEGSQEAFAQFTLDEAAEVLRSEGYYVEIVRTHTADNDGLPIYSVHEVRLKLPGEEGLPSVLSESVIRKIGFRVMQENHVPG